MTTDANNVTVHYTGAVRVAAVGTTAPTGSSGSFGAGWIDLGYISEDGITETPNADWNEIRAWQNRDIVRRTLNSSDVEFQFQMIESKQEVLELYYPGSVMQHSAGADPVINIVAPSYDVRAFAFDYIDGTKHERIIVPKGVVTDRGDIVHNGTDAVFYEVTVTALASGLVDADGRSIYATRTSDNPAWAAFSSA